MGLLDDAIREHLDLKRRRGADPSEVARAEQEALGPVRREPVPSAEAADEHHHDEPQAPLHVDDGAHPAEDHTRVLAPDERHEAPHGDPLRERAEPEAARPAPEPSAPTTDPQDPRHSDIVHQPTTEFRVEDHHDDEHPEAAAEPEPPRRREPEQSRQPEHATQPVSDEDVLEETPEFLQETPEHDRLWFEQRPPRDFDFDG